MEAGHSPLPWALDEDGFICDANGAEIMHHYYDEAVIEAPDSAFIVRACNSHERLVAALRESKRTLNAARVAARFHAPHTDELIDAALAAAGAA